VKELSNLGGKMFELLKGGTQEPAPRPSTPAAAAPPSADEESPAEPVVRFRGIRPGAPA
jgi:hypothetical protein